MSSVTNGVLYVDGGVYGTGTGTLPGGNFYGASYSGIVVQNGGVLSGKWLIESGGFIKVYEGGTISGPVIDGGTLITYNNNTVAWGSAGGVFELLSGGTDAYEAPPACNAEIIVSSAATISNAVLQSGNSLIVEGGGILSAGTIGAGATLTLSNGASNSNLVLDGGTVDAYETPHFTNVGGGGTIILESGAIDSSYATTNSGNITYEVKSGAVFESSQIPSGWNVTVASGGIVSVLTVDSGGSVTISSGGDLQGSWINSGGQVVLLSGAKQTIENSINGGTLYTYVEPNLNIIKNGQIVLESGAIYQNEAATDMGGNTFSINSGALMESTTLSSGDSATVSSGGNISALTINTGATVTLNSGSTNYGLTLDGGTVDAYTTPSFYQSALHSGTIILESGAIDGSYGSAGSGDITYEVKSGAVFESSQVPSGWNVTVASGGTVSALTVDSGATISAANGAIISGTVTVQDGGHVTIGADAGGTIDLVGDTNAGLVISGLESGGTLNTVISGFTGTSSSSDSIELAGVKAADVTSVTYPSTDQVELALNNGKSITLNITGVKNYGFNLSDGSDGWLDYEVCFLSGSMIRTPDGDVAVEDLRIGDQVVTFDWQNNIEIAHPVVWVGKAHANVRPGLSDDEVGYPVRILKDAIADGVPYKDMLITPEHCLFFEGKFVPVRMLVNGVSIFYDKSITSYDYYHVETAKHSVITADGMLTESYLDTGNRRAFRQEGKVATLRGAVQNWEENAGAPLCVDRAFVEPLFHKLALRNTIDEHSQVKLTELVTDPDLHLVTESGATIRPIRHDGQRYSFMLPANTTFVRIVSRASRPADVVGPFVDDRRMLGVAVADAYFVTARKLTPVTAHLQSEKPEGWHATDWTDCAWTNGNAALPLGTLTHAGMGILSLNIRAAGPYKPEITEPVLTNTQTA